MKVHLKNAVTDHLSLCRKWPEKNWVLRTSVHTQNAGSICKICAQIDQPFKSEAGGCAA